MNPMVETAESLDAEIHKLQTEIACLGEQVREAAANGARNHARACQNGITVRKQILRRRIKARNLLRIS